MAAPIEITPDILRLFRQMRGWTFDDMARFTGYSRNTIRAMEYRTSPISPRIVSILKLAAWGDTPGGPAEPRPPQEEAGQ